MNSSFPPSQKLLITVVYSTVMYGGVFLWWPVVLGNENNQENLLLDQPLVHQLNSEIKSTDWAFTTLQSLLKKYGVNEQQLSTIFNHDETLTREQFAIVLDQALTELLENQEPYQINPEDLTIINQLKGQFATDLAILRGKADGLQARVTEQELTLFSPTTQLRGMVYFNLASANFSNSIQSENFNNNQSFITQINQGNITFSQGLELGFLTSFSGEDLLLTNLVISNNHAPINNLRSRGSVDKGGLPFALNTVTFPDHNVIIQELLYQLPINDNFFLTIAPQTNWANYFDNLVNFLPHSFNHNSLTAIREGAGIISLWQVNDQLQFTTAFLKENNSRLNDNSSPETKKNGLFEGTYGLTSQLTYAPTNSVNLQLLYQQNFNLEMTDGKLIESGIFGVANDGQGGNLKSANSHLIGLSLDWFFTEKMRFFASYNYSNTQLNFVNSQLGQGQINAQQIHTGVNILDWGKTGTITTLAYRIPFDILTGQRYLLTGGGNGATEQEFSASYYYPVNNYLAVIPSFYLIVNPNNFHNNSNIYVGNLQMQLLF